MQLVEADADFERRRTARAWRSRKLRKDSLGGQRVLAYAAFEEIPGQHRFGKDQHVGRALDAAPRCRNTRSTVSRFAAS